MAKKYDFKNYKVNTEAEKASPILEHDYHPVKDDKDIVVRCRHFRAGEKLVYTSLKPTGEKDAEGNENITANFDYRGIFAAQVDSISGLVVTVTDAKTGKEKDLEIKDAESLLGFPDVGIFNTIVNNTSIHLISGDTLNGDEQGN